MALGSTACGWACPLGALVCATLVAAATARVPRGSAALDPAPRALAAAHAARLGAVGAAPNISWWQTVRDTSDRLTPQRAPLAWQPGPCAARPVDGNTTFATLDAGTTFQTIFGFGGAITESAVYVFSGLDAAAQQEVVASLWGENSNGTSLRYSTGRLTIGSCDFALEYYNYNEMRGDVNMTNFTIAHDQAALIPFILNATAAAQAAGRPLRFVASPWSPPAWMKTNYPLNNYTITAMSCFPLGPLDCTLIPEYQPAYALYLSKYLSAYTAAGVSIWAITPQNEPQPQTGTLTYEGMLFDFSAELEFVAEYLGPQLAADHPDVHILIFDHNTADAVGYATPILADPVASSYVSGVALHWYEQPNEDPMNELHALFPDKFLLATEATAARGTADGWFKDEVGQWSVGEFYGTYILNDLNAWSVGFIDWNFMLDERGAPSHADPTGELCEGLIPCGSDSMLIVDTTVSPHQVYKQPFYWAMGHVSRFVPPGSLRVGFNVTRAPGSNTTAPTPVLGSAFLTPDGSTAMILMNPGNYSEELCLSDARFGTVRGVLPPHSFQTWVY